MVGDMRVFNITFIKIVQAFALTVLLSIFNIAHATSAIVKVEDLGLLDWDPIEQLSPGAGSSGPVSLDWDPNNNFFTELIAWNWGYSGTGGASCWIGENCALDLSVSDNSTSLMLESFFLGYFGSEGIVEYHVIDLETDTSILSGAPLVSGSSGSLINVNAVSNVGFRILFGPDGFNGGINNIAYSYDATGQGPVVTPIPAAVWFFGSGLLGLISFMRRQA
jgi:hypothetical protein